jgi:tetratricopeptide (TPR) repeat protein
MGGLLLTVGQLEDAREHFLAALDAYDEAQPQGSALGSDLGVFAHAWYSHACWLLGDETEAVRHSTAAVALALRREHPYSETLAFAYAGLLHQMRGDIDRVRACAREVIARCERYGFAYYGDWGHMLTGWAGKEPSAGIVAIEAALERLDQQRAQARRPYYLSLLADTCFRAGQPARAAEILDGAIVLARERVELWWLPALYLQRAVIAPSPQREAGLQLALDLARAQGSRGLEQRIVATAGLPSA